MISSIKHIGEAIPYIRKIMKRLKYMDDDLRDIMKDEAKLIEFSKILYSELPPHLKFKIKEEDFINSMKQKSVEVMKSKKNKKKVFG